mgnify:FL=1
MVLHYLLLRIIFQEIDDMSLIEQQGNGFNSDLSARIVIIESQEKWRSSPSDGVKRIYLDRADYTEYTSATSIVKFDRRSRFLAHDHKNGEEFLVLDGIFSDEYGDYHKGTYVRNPHGSCHSPYSKDGCKIFVKLRQFQKGDTARVVKSMSEPWKIYNEEVDFLKLHQFKTEIAYLAKFKPYSEVKMPFKNNNGEEILILSGNLCDSTNNFSAVTWIRDPKSCFEHASAGAHGLCIFVKSGHLF